MRALSSRQRPLDKPIIITLYHSNGKAFTFVVAYDIITCRVTGWFRKYPEMLSLLKISCSQTISIDHKFSFRE